MGEVKNGSYECRHEDPSILRGVFDKIFCEPVLKRLPAGTTPNHITLLGGVSILISDIFIYLSISGLGPCFLAAAFFLFIYTICDDLDGLHAKKNGLASKRGEFFDHWLDSIVVANNITISALIVGLHGILLSILALSAFFAFYLPVREQKETGIFRLTAIGPVEGLLINIIFYILAFFLYGRPAFTFQERSVNIAFVFAIIAIAGFLFSGLASLIRVRSNLTSLLLPLSYAIVFCSSIYLEKNNIYISFACLLFINVVLSGNIQIVRLSQRKRKTRTLLNYIILPFALLMLLPEMSNGTSTVILNGICLFLIILMFSDVIFAFKHLPAAQKGARICREQ